MKEEKIMHLSVKMVPVEAEHHEVQGGVRQLVWADAVEGEILIIHGVTVIIFS